MNDSWYDEHMFEIAAPTEYLTEKMKDGLTTTPVVLPAWDPMGSLAKYYNIIKDNHGGCALRFEQN